MSSGQNTTTLGDLLADDVPVPNDLGDGTLAEGGGLELDDQVTGPERQVGAVGARLGSVGGDFQEQTDSGAAINAAPPPARPHR